MRAEELKGHLDALARLPAHRHRRPGTVGQAAEWRDFTDMITGALEGRPWPNPA